MNPVNAEGIAEIIVALLLGLAILVPVVALAARFALKPVMETWLQFKKSDTTDQERMIQDRRIALLEAELQALQQAMQQRVEAQEFDRALGKPRNE